MADGNNNGNQQNRNYNNNYVSRKDSGFDVFAPLKNPIQNSAIATWWVVIGIPILVAFLFGTYSKNDIFGVIGISFRRATTAAIEEAKPVGQTLCEQRYGASNCTTDSLKISPATTTTTTNGSR